MLLPLVALFVVVPIVELYLLLQVGQAIGVLPTIALLVADSVLGGVLLRAQGRSAWRRLRETLAAGRMPAREVIDGALIIFGGALLLTPGFLSDILGLILLLPPTRALVRALLLRRFAARVVAGAASGAQTRMGRMFTFEAGRRPGSGAGPGRRRGASDFDDADDDDGVVEGTAREVPRQPRELP